MIEALNGDSDNWEENLIPFEATSIAEETQVIADAELLLPYFSFVF